MRNIQIAQDANGNWKIYQDREEFNEIPYASKWKAIEEALELLHASEFRYPNMGIVLIVDPTRES